MTTLLTINLLVLMIAAWLSVLVVVPRCKTSRFRYLLWQQRDELVDEVRHGEYENPKGAEGLIALIETAIEDAHDLTAINFVSFRLLFTRHMDLHKEDPFGLADLNAADRRRLREHLTAVDHTLFDKAFLWTPSGWLLLPVLLLLALLSMLRSRGRRPSVVQPTARRIREDLALSNPDDRMHGPVSQYV